MSWSSIISFLLGLGLGLKIAGIISLNWWLIFSPLLVCIGLCMIMFFIIVVNQLSRFIR